MRQREREAVEVAIGEQAILAAAAPYRADRVDHVARGQIEAWRDLGLAGVATAERLAGIV